MEEDIQSEDQDPVNEKKYAPIQEDQQYIEIVGVNEIIDTESAAFNVRISYGERHPVEILYTTMKLKVYMKASRGS